MALVALFHVFMSAVDNDTFLKSVIAVNSSVDAPKKTDNVSRHSQVTAIYRIRVTMFEPKFLSTLAYFIAYLCYRELYVVPKHICLLSDAGAYLFSCITYPQLIHLFLL